MNSRSTQPADFSDVTGGASGFALDPGLFKGLPSDKAIAAHADASNLLQYQDEQGNRYSPEQIADYIQTEYRTSPKQTKTLLGVFMDNNRKISRAFVGAAGDLVGVMAGAPVDAARGIYAAMDPNRTMSQIPGAEFGMAGAGARTDALQDMIAPPPEPGLGSAGEKGLEGAAAGAPFGPMGMLSGVFSGIAGDVASRASLSPFATWLISTTAGLVPGLAANAGPMLRKPIMGNVAPPSTQAAFAAAEAPVTPATQSAPGSFANKAEHMLAHIAGGNKPVFNQSQKVSMGFWNTLEKIKGKLGGAATVTEAGEVAQKAGEQWIKRWQRQSAKLWEKFAQQTPLDTPTDASNVLLKTRELVLKNAGRPEMFRNEVTEKYYKQLTDWLHLGGDTRPTVGDLLKIRTQIGEDLGRVGSPGAITPSRGELKTMYKAVSADIEASLTTPAQRAAFKAANKITREGHATLDKIIKPVLAKNTPEEAFNYMMGGSRDGATRLGHLYSGMTKEQRRLVTAANLERMGHSATNAPMEAAEFRPDRWLSNYERVSPEARAILFKDFPDDAREQLNSLVKVAQKQRANQSKLGQPTTALATSYSSILTRMGIGFMGGASTGASLFGIPGAVFGAPIGAVSSLTPQLTARVIGNFLTSPRAFTWLLKQSTLPESMAASQINALKQEGIRYGDMVAIDLANMLMENGQPGEAEAASVLQSSGGTSLTTGE